VVFWPDSWRFDPPYPVEAIAAWLRWPALPPLLPIRRTPCRRQRDATQRRSGRNPKGIWVSRSGRSDRVIKRMKKAQEKRRPLRRVYRRRSAVHWLRSAQNPIAAPGHDTITAKSFMAVQQVNYDHRGKGNWGIVLCCPRIVAPERLVYFVHNRQSDGWAIRDFISGLWLNDHHSRLTVADIEADAVYDEFPPRVAVETDSGEWLIYLRLRTTAYLGRGREVPMQMPNPQSGTWEPL
jgi:hypothetical protein